MRYILLIILCIFSQGVAAQVAAPSTFEHDGIEREHYLYVPKDADENTPLIIALHGMGGNAKNLRYGIGMTRSAEKHGFAVVYPQGLRLPEGSRHWNAGIELMDVDDVGYLSALATHINATYGLSSRIAVFGISMGGSMSYHLACNSGLNITAVVSVAGNIPAADLQNCTASPRPSLLHIHGELDELVSFNGADHWADNWAPKVGVPLIVQGWANTMNARPAPGVVDHYRVIETHYLSPDNLSEVQLLLLSEFGHDWPSIETADFNALAPIMDFIGRHSHLH